jgi:hypothetical protein
VKKPTLGRRRKRKRMHCHLPGRGYRLRALLCPPSVVRCLWFEARGRSTVPQSMSTGPPLKINAPSSVNTEAARTNTRLVLIASFLGFSTVQF